VIPAERHQDDGDSKKLASGLSGGLGALIGGTADNKGDGGCSWLKPRDALNSARTARRIGMTFFITR